MNTRKVVASLGVLALAAAAGLFFFVRSQVQPEALRAQLVAQLGKYFSGKIEVASVEVVPFRTVRVRGLKLSAPDGSKTYVSLGALDATVDPWSILAWKPRVVGVLLDAPVVDVARVPGGALDVQRWLVTATAPTAPHAAAPPAAPPATSGPNLAVAVDSLALRAGQVTYRDPALGLSAPLAARDVDGRFALAGDTLTIRSLTATLAGGRLEATGKVLELGAPRLDVAATIAGQAEELFAWLPTGPAARAVAGAFRVEAVGRGPVAAPVVTGTLTSPQLEYRAASGAKMALRDVRGALSYEKLVATLNSLTASVFGGTLEGTGGADLAARPLAYHFDVTSLRLDAGAMAGGLGGPSAAGLADKLHGTLGVKAVGRGAGAEVAGLAAGGTLSLGALEVAGVSSLDQAADALGMPALKTLKLPAFEAPFTVKDGAAEVRTPEVVLNEGIRALPGSLHVGADGALGGGFRIQLPWKLILGSPRFTDEIGKLLGSQASGAGLTVAALAKELEGKPGPTVDLELRGTTAAPAVQHGSAAQLSQAVLKAVLADLPKHLESLAVGRLLGGNPGQALVKGPGGALLGRLLGQAPEAPSSPAPAAAPAPASSSSRSAALLKGLFGR